MKREPRTEVASVRVTKAEHDQLAAMGGPTTVVRRALGRAKESMSYRVAKRNGPGSTYCVWDDGTIGQNWPAVTTRW